MNRRLRRLPDRDVSRRQFLAAASMAAAGIASPGHGAEPSDQSAQPGSKKAQVAISLDLEMARNFPGWEDMHWDYEKGNLNAEAKAYAVEAARRVKAKGGRVHFFLVCRALEQEDVGWLQGIIKE